MSEETFVAAYRRHASTVPGRDDLEARRRFARQLLERALVAQQATARGLDTLPEVRAHVRRATDRAVRAAYLRQQIGDAIPPPTEAEVRAAFERVSARLRLQQIYAATQGEADSLYALVQRGASFDSLAQASMRRYGVPNPEAAGDMGWVTWNDLDEAPEDMAFALEPGEVSPPVASLRGWHLFRLNERTATVRLDADAYASQRERLAFELWQRRFDEASARHIRAVVEPHRLAIRLRPLAAVWAALAPLVPDRPTPASVALLTAETATLAPAELPRSTPVATVDGQVFTAGQLLDALPDIPLPFWQPNLRPALELAVRDSILAAVARQAQADTARSVRHARAEATTTARYYAALRAAADTLDRDHAKERLYVQAARRFTDPPTTTYRAYRFADSSAAWRAVRSAAALADTAAARAALRGATAEMTIETRTVTGDEAGALPVHTLPISGKAPVVAGPYPEGDAWVIVEPLRRVQSVQPFESVEAELDRLLPGALPALAHQSLLPPDYDPADVVLDDAVLRDALPFYYELGGTP